MRAVLAGYESQLPHTRVSSAAYRRRLNELFSGPGAAATLQRLSRMELQRRAPGDSASDLGPMWTAGRAPEWGAQEGDGPEAESGALRAEAVRTGAL